MNQPSPVLKDWGFAVWASRMTPKPPEEGFEGDAPVVPKRKSICFDLLAMCPAKRVRPSTSLGWGFVPKVCVVPSALRLRSRLSCWLLAWKSERLLRLFGAALLWFLTASRLGFIARWGAYSGAWLGWPLGGGGAFELFCCLSVDVGSVQCEPVPQLGLLGLGADGAGDVPLPSPTRGSC